MLFFKSACADPLLIADIAMTKNNIVKIKTHSKPELHQFGGYINSVYVRFNVEIDNNQVHGQLFDKHGNAKYIYGEFYNGILMIYDQNNTQYNVIVE